MKAARTLLALLALALSSAAAIAQGSIVQSGAWAPGHAPMYVGQGSGQAVVQDSGTAAGGGVGVGLKELLLTVRGTGAAPYANAGTGRYATNFCNYDGPTTGAFHYLCMSPNAQGGGLIAYGAAGGAPNLPLNFIINGTTYQFPFAVGGIVGPGTTVVNNIVTWNNTIGTLVKDSGIAISSIPSTASPNTWTGLQTFTGGAIVPTQSVGNSTTNAASTAFVQAAIANNNIFKISSGVHEGLWITDNATWTGTIWNRIDNTKYAMAINIRALENLPYEASTVGTSIWYAAPVGCPGACVTQISDTYGSAAGWLTGTIATNFGGFVIGGECMEIDGLGIIPYGRICNTQFGGNNYRGILSNIYADFSGVDDAADPSWFIGQYNDSFSIRRAAAGAGVTLTELLTVDTTGAITKAASINLSGTVAPLLGAYAPVANTLTLTSRGLKILEMINPSSAVNYFTLTGAATGQSPAISPAGSDTNIPMVFISKGSGEVSFFTNATDKQVAIPHTASPVNYLTLTGAATGAGPTISLVGTDTNVDINVTPKGTGTLRINGTGYYIANAAVASVFTANSGPTGANTAIQGWIRFKDASGTLRYMPYW